MLVLHISERFFLTALLKRQRLTMYIYLFIVTIPVNFTGEFRKLFEATTYVGIVLRVLMCVGGGIFDGSTLFVTNGA
jgi:hypothetical protein